MGKTRPPYPLEVRAEAVRLVRSENLSVMQVSRELGVSDQPLRHGLRQTAIDAGEREGLTSDERAELRALRKENRVLREEREILKKAAVGSTDRCNTSYGLASIRRWTDGLWRVTGADA
jgi:transposase